MVLFLFVIMLLRPGKEKLLAINPRLKIFAFILAFLVFVQLIYIIFMSSTSDTKGLDASIKAGTIETIGMELFSKYILPVEAAGFLLLAATIGALVLAKKKFE